MGPVHHVRGGMAWAALLLSSALAGERGLCQTPDGGDALAQTLVRGMLHRAQLIETIEGSASVRLVRSDRERRRIAADMDAAHTPASTPAEAEGRPPGGPVSADGVSGEESTWLAFQADVAEGRFQAETVSLTNNGCPDVLTTWAAGPALRALPPWFFYRALVADRVKESSYDRCANSGVIYLRHGDFPLDLHLQNAYSYLVLTLAPDKLGRLSAGNDEVRHMGEREAAPWGRAHELLVLRHEDGWAAELRLTVAPELGFAVIRYQHRVLDASPSGEYQPANARRCTPSGFAEVAPGIWCPKAVQIDDFDYALGAGEDAWMCTRVYEVIDLRVNEPVHVPDPGVFPLGVHPLDLSSGTWVAGGERPPAPAGSIVVAPLEFPPP